MARTLARIVAALAAVAGAALLIAAPAVAHTALVSSSPAEGATVTELPEVTLVFTEQLLDIGHELALEGPDGTVTALAIEQPVTDTVTAAVPADALVAGECVLRYRVVASDGHPIEGVVTFTYAPPGTVSATPDPDDATASPSPASSPSASPSPEVTASPGAGVSAPPRPPVDEPVGPNPAVYLIIGALAAAGLALTVALRMHGQDG